MKLLIVESPSKAKTIGKYLGKDFKVVASIGHVRDLPKSSKKAIDMDHFTPNYIISPGKEKVLAEIRSLAKDATEVYLATDPDREGEAISWHIKEAIDLSERKAKRVTFHEITKDAVLEAIEHPRKIDDNLRRAQEARRVLDRLVGYDLSGLIWKKVRYGLSAGRVQSPALRILCEREREINAFKPEPFWVLEALTLHGPSDSKKSKSEIKFTAEDVIKSGEIATELVPELKKAKWSVASVEDSEAKRTARAPFTTSTLQQTASTRLGYSPSRTMMLAQKLYEAGHITYMRTDSTNMSAQAIGSIAGVVKKNFGEGYSAPRNYATKNKNAQEAHEAIRPSNAGARSAGSTPEQKKLYELIWSRAVSSQMVDAKIMRTKIVAGISPEPRIATDPKFKTPVFSIVGSRTIFDGWLAADPSARGEDVELPKVNQGDTLDLQDTISTQKFTEPPPRYTEAGLIKELEKRGIGRPSTYASIIHTIEERGYVEKQGRSLKPTDTGDVVSKFLEDNFGEYISDTFTADMEDRLDDIANGSIKYEPTLRTFYVPFAKEVKARENTAKVTTLGEADPKWKCPKCGSSMQIKLGRSGKFLSCSRYPDCEGSLTINGEEIKKDAPIGVDPDTNMPVFLNVGRFGPYVQLGEKSKENKKPRMASVPKTFDLSKVTIDDAMKFLSLPRNLGQDPKTGKDIIASAGRFGPYVMLDGDFRSLKKDDVYTIDLARALEILAEPKKARGFRKKNAGKSKAK